MKIEDYEIVIRPLTPGEGGGFFAFVSDLPGCHSDGESPQEALANVYDAFACWIEGLEEMGARSLNRVGRPHRAVGNRDST